jgi:hypothetical protein
MPAHCSHHTIPYSTYALQVTTGWTAPTESDRNGGSTSLWTCTKLSMPSRPPPAISPARCDPSPHPSSPPPHTPLHSLPTPTSPPSHTPLHPLLTTLTPPPHLPPSLACKGIRELASWQKVGNLSEPYAPMSIYSPVPGHWVDELPNQSLQVQYSTHHALSTYSTAHTMHYSPHTTVQHTPCTIHPHCTA